MAHVLTLDDLRATPAEVQGTGAIRENEQWVVFGHHFGGDRGPGRWSAGARGAIRLPARHALDAGRRDARRRVADSVICSARSGAAGSRSARWVREEVGPFAGAIALVSIVAIMIILLAVLALVVVNRWRKARGACSRFAATMPIRRHGPGNEGGRHSGARWAG